ncbi:MAG: hypothetical protein KBC34_05680 [Phenylobacterium sp.]|nr:hypothetical protein [Phenylobacterium sp.]
MDGDIRLEDYVLLGVCMAAGLAQFVFTLRSAPSKVLRWYVAAAAVVVVVTPFAGGVSSGEAATELGVSQYGPAFILMWGLVALAWLMAGHIAGRSIRAVWRGRHR